MTPKMERARAAALAQMQKWGLAGWGFRFNARRRGLGLCVYPQGRTPGRIELSMHFVEMNPESEVLDTILHEVAHALAGPDTGHGPAWVEKCRLVGARPDRCGDAVMPVGRYRANCPSCGKLYHRHKRPKYVVGYYCIPCGKERGALRYTLH
jgi:predicted SprT family Zn-dependent metalloprotease